MGLLAPEECRLCCVPERFISDPDLSMFPSSRRPLLRAMTASALIHAALLLSVASVFPLRFESPATRISVAILASAHRQPAPTPAASAPAAKPLLPPEPRRAPKMEEAHVVERSPETPPTLSASPAGSETASAAPSSPAPAARGGALAPTGGNPAPARAGVNADDLRQYSMSLGIAARRFKRYPALARERGWEGRAEVALIFRASLPLPEVVLARSSGRAVLDEQAVDMMTQAARVTALPDGLKGREFRLPQAVQFSLADDQ
jgi:periplasmic protein TonB